MPEPTPPQPVADKLPSDSRISDFTFMLPNACASAKFCRIGTPNGSIAASQGQAPSRLLPTSTGKPSAPSTTPPDVSLSSRSYSRDQREDPSPIGSVPLASVQLSPTISTPVAGPSGKNAQPPCSSALSSAL